MDERRYLDIISGRETGLSASLSRLGLSTLTPVYRLAIALRNGLFDASIRRRTRLDVPVISVGNLTTGGTGKTPVVAWLANWLSEHRRHPGIISRGYQALDDAGNDEFRVLQQVCPDVPHVQNRNRIAAARQLRAAAECDVLLVDDGFQHRQLFRDLDVVLIDATNPLGYGRLLPRGLLREPLTALERADLVILTRCDQVDHQERSNLRKRLAQTAGVPIVEVAFRPTELISLQGERTELSQLAGKGLLGFCGIGNPQGFARTLEAAGLGTPPLESFADHYHYTADDLQRLISRAGTGQATALVTTLKDLVKLERDWAGDFPVWAVDIGVQVLSGRDDLERLLSGLLAETGAHGGG